MKLYLMAWHRDKFTFVWFNVLMAASMKMRAFWDIAPCSLGVDRHFGRAYCLHHQGDEIYIFTFTKGKSQQIWKFVNRFTTIIRRNWVLFLGSNVPSQTQNICLLKTRAFCDIAPFSFIGTDQCFRSVSGWFTLMMQYAPLKRRSIPTKVHSTIS
jgi:hypothetical protein